MSSPSIPIACYSRSGVGYADAAMFKAATPYGASSVSLDEARAPTADDLEVARFQGRRVAFVARAFTARHITETAA